MSVSFSSWGLGRAAVCDCGTPWTFLLPFFQWYLEEEQTKTRNNQRLRYLEGWISITSGLSPTGILLLVPRWFSASFCMLSFCFRLRSVLFCHSFIRWLGKYRYCGLSWVYLRVLVDCLQLWQSIHTSKFPRVVVHLVILDQWNQTARF